MNFKIYQIHEYGGQWAEDSFDDIVESYLSEEKAIAKKEKLEIEEEQIRELYLKCISCPLRRHKKEDAYIEEYCDKYEPFDENKHSLDEFDGDEPCVNYTWYHDNSYFRIDEVEVIE